MITNYMINTTEEIIFNSNNETAIVSMMFCNRSIDTPDYVYVYAVPNGQVAGNQNIILNKVYIAAQDTFLFSTPEKLILGDLDKIYAKSENGTITVTTSYINL